MGYNWEEIFKSKSNKELYRIYKGDTTLPVEAKAYAERELELRKFDFNNMEANRDGWKLERLAGDEIIEAKTNSPIKVYYTKYHYPLFFAGILLVVFVLNDFNADINRSSITTFVALTVLMFIYVWINNYFYKKRERERIERRAEIVRLTEKLRNEGLLTNGSPIVEELKRNARDTIESDKKMAKIGTVVLVIWLIAWLIEEFL